MLIRNFLPCQRKRGLTLLLYQFYIDMKGESIPGSLFTYHCSLTIDCAFKKRKCSELFKWYNTAQLCRQIYKWNFFLNGSTIYTFSVLTRHVQWFTGFCQEASIWYCIFNLQGSYYVTQRLATNFVLTAWKWRVAELEPSSNNQNVSCVCEITSLCMCMNTGHFQFAGCQALTFLAEGRWDLHLENN